MSRKFVRYPKDHVKASNSASALKKQVNAIERKVLSNSAVVSAIGSNSELKVLLKIYSNLVNQSGVDCATLTINLECNGYHRLGHFVAAPEGYGVDTRNMLMSGARVIELTPNMTLSDAGAYEVESAAVQLMLSAIEAAKADLADHSSASDNAPSAAKQFGLQIANTIARDVNRRVKGASLKVQNASATLIDSEEVLFTCDLTDSVGLELNIYKSSSGAWDALGRDWEYEADDLVDLLNSGN